MIATVVQDLYFSWRRWAPNFEVHKRTLQLNSCVVVMLEFVQVQLHQQLDININMTELNKFAHKPCVVHPGSVELPLRWFECHPVASKRIAIMTVHVTSESCVTVMWAGDVWAYRGLLRAAGATSLPLCFNGCNIRMLSQP